MNDAQLLQRTANQQRPLLGLTVLVVEDSRYACEALRLMCLRSGARIRRADSLRSARMHLKTYRPTIAMIDLGLPDGPGLSLIEELNRASPRIQCLIGISGDECVETATMAAGADAFLPKPIRELQVFQQTILECLPKELQPVGPRALTREVIEPDQMAYWDDLNHINILLEETYDSNLMDYVAQFTGGLARSAKDTPLYEAATKLGVCRSKGRPYDKEVATLAGLIQSRLTEAAVV